MRDLPCEKAGEGGIWAGDHGWGGGRSAGLLPGPWEVIFGGGPHVPPQLRCSSAPVTGVTEVIEDAGSSTQGGIRAAKPCSQSFPTAAVSAARTCSCSCLSRSRSARSPALSCCDQQARARGRLQSSPKMRISKLHLPIPYTPSYEIVEAVCHAGHAPALSSLASRVSAWQRGVSVIDLA